MEVNTEDLKVKTPNSLIGPAPSVTIEQVLSDALSLSEAVRHEVAEALIASIEAARLLILDPELLGVVKRREAELDAGTVTPIPWEDVKRRVRGLTSASG